MIVDEALNEDDGDAAACQDQFLSRCPLFALHRLDFSFCRRPGTVGCRIFTFLPLQPPFLWISHLRERGRTAVTLNASNTNALRYVELENIFTKFNDRSYLGSK